MKKRDKKAIKILELLKNKWETQQGETSWDDHNYLTDTLSVYLNPKSAIVNDLRKASLHHNRSYQNRYYYINKLSHAVNLIKQNGVYNEKTSLYKCINNPFFYRVVLPLLGLFIGLVFYLGFLFGEYFYD